MMSTIRGNNQPPDPPVPATTALLAEAGATTEVVAPGAGVVAAAGSSLSPWAKFGLLSLALVPAVVIPIAVAHNAGKGAPQDQRATCNPQLSFQGCP